MAGPVTKSNEVNPLDWRVPIVNTDGTPTNEFMRKWLQQGSTNADIPDLTTAKAVSAVLDVLTSVVGSLLVRGSTQWTGLAPNADGRVLRDKGPAATPIWDTISNVLDTIANTRGGLVYRGAGGWAVLVPSGAGKVLTDGGVGADPSWQPSSGGGGGAASIQDDGTNVYIALSDTDGQLVLDGSGDPIFSVEVFPASAIPAGVPAQTAYLTPGTFTFTPAATTKRIRVWMKGSGAGGSGNGQGANGPGSNGSVASVVPTSGTVTAIAAAGGLAPAANHPSNGGGPGSSGSGWSPINIRRMQGCPGGGVALLFWDFIAGTNIYGVLPGSGGGRGGGAAGHNTTAATAGAANTGGGGSGVGFTPADWPTIVHYSFACGGSEAEEVWFDVVIPAGMTYTIVVPAGGAGGVGSGTDSHNGAAGGSGFVYIEEYPL